MQKRLAIPYIKSRGFECGQACAAMMIKYYYPEFVPNFDEFNKVIRHQTGMYTFPPQTAILLDHYGVKAKAFSSEDVKKSDEDPDQFKRWFGKDYRREMKFIDLESFDWMVSEVRKRRLFEVKRTKFEDLISYFRQGFLVCLPIDWNTLVKERGHYEGHFVILSGIEKDNILIHDPDVGPFLSYPINKLKKAWQHPAIAEDYFIAFGKK